MSCAVRHQPSPTPQVSCVIYMISLFVLYLASTLFHATFAMEEHIASFFAMMDQCAIYLLSAPHAQREP